MKNILLILADQLDKYVLSAYGGHEIQTVNIDEIARDGIRFDEAYTPSAVCTTSRGCLLTGLSPFMHGAFRNGIPVAENAEGFASYLRKQYGYRTEYIGKWHLGSKNGIGDSFASDNLLGFDFPYGANETAHAKSVSDDGSFQREITRDGRYMTDWIADRTIERLEKYDNSSPFFLVASFPDPHQPYLVREPYGRMFNPADMEIPSTFNEKILPDWAEYDEWGRKHYFHMNAFSRDESFQMMKAQYFGEIMCLDENIGRLLSALRKTNHDSDTVVVFTSDHGEYLGRHGLMEKNNLYRDVYNIPLLMKSKGTLDKSSVSARMLDIRDIPATILHAADIEVDGKFADGVDALLDKNEREYVPIYPSDVPRSGRIRKNDEIAFVGRSYDRTSVFKDHILFDRATDPNQIHNLFGSLDDESVRRRGLQVLLDMKQGNVSDEMIPRILLDLG